MAWGAGRVPVGINTGDGNFNTVEKTGGSSVVTLTANQMPPHAYFYRKRHNNRKCRRSYTQHWT